MNNISVIHRCAWRKRLTYGWAPNAIISWGSLQCPPNTDTAILPVLPQLDPLWHNGNRTHNLRMNLMPKPWPQLRSNPLHQCSQNPPSPFTRHTLVYGGSILFKPKGPQYREHRTKLFNTRRSQQIFISREAEQIWSNYHKHQAN